MSSYYTKHIKEKVKKDYNIDFIVETGIAKGNLLLKDVGTKQNNFPVWAGETINMAALISKKLKSSVTSDNIGITANIYDNIKTIDELSYSCKCVKKDKLWKKSYIPNGNGQSYYSLFSKWCDIHGQEYINRIIDDHNIIQS